MFSFYERLAALYDARIVSVRSRRDLSFDAEGIAVAAREHGANLIVLTTPNSPTGLAMPIEEVQAVLESTPGFVLVDEAYGEFSTEPSALTLMPVHPNLLILRTFSKAFGLAGLRTGYLLGHAPVIQEILKARVPFMVDRLSELAAMALLERPAMLQERIEQIKKGTRWLQTALGNMPQVTVLPSQANFVIFRPALNTEGVMRRLIDHNVLVRNIGSYEGLDGYLRVSAGTDEENKHFIASLTTVLAGVAA